MLCTREASKPAGIQPANQRAKICCSGVLNRSATTAYRNSSSSTPVKVVQIPIE